MGCADSVAVDGKRGSNVYEVNPWLWRFGRGKPRLNVEETSLRKEAANEAWNKHGVESNLDSK
jgi:hypothetical protein